MYCIDKQAGFIYNRFMNMKSSKTWIVIFAAVLVICAAAFLLLKGSGGHGAVAVIRVDGEIYEKSTLTPSLLHMTWKSRRSLGIINYT